MKIYISFDEFWVCVREKEMKPKKKKLSSSDIFMHSVVIMLQWQKCTAQLHVKVAGNKSVQKAFSTLLFPGPLLGRKYKS